MNRELIIDFMDEEYQDTGFSECVDIIKEKLGLKTDCNVLRIEKHLSHSQDVTYKIANDEHDLYEILNDTIECFCPKNGCQIYEDNGKHYFCLTDANYYDKETGGYKGTDEIHIYIKDFNW